MKYIGTVVLAESDNKFQNRVCQRGALRCETEAFDAMTSGFVSGLFTVHFVDRGQTMQ